MTADEAGDVPLKAFKALLHSENVAAVCTAMGMYQTAAEYTRLTGGNPLEPVADEVRQRARDLLRRPPTPGDGDVRPAADHLSALNVLTILAEAEDAELIGDTLEGAADPEVRVVAIRTAASVLTNTAGQNGRLMAVIGAIVFDETLELRQRKVALTALGMVGTPEAEELLVRATESDDVELQIAAAFQLAAPGRIHGHRERLVRLAGSWPEDAGRDAGFIRERLAGLPS
jgi:HEAT repeat protein